MARQIKTFKRKLRNLEVDAPNEEIKEVNEPLSVFENTHLEIQKSCDQKSPQDHKDLLKNLSLIIAENRLKPNSYDFNRICRFVRELMPFHLLCNLNFQNNSAIYQDMNRGTLEFKDQSNFLYITHLQENYCLCNEKYSKSDRSGSFNPVVEDNKPTPKLKLSSTIQLPSLNNICSLLKTNFS